MWKYLHVSNGHKTQLPISFVWVPPNTLEKGTTSISQTPLIYAQSFGPQWQAISWASWTLDLTVEASKDDLQMNIRSNLKSALNIYSQDDYLYMPRIYTKKE